VALFRGGHFLDSEKDILHMKKLLPFGAVGLVAILIAAPAVRADIIDLVSLQSRLAATRAHDAGSRLLATDGTHDFAVGGFRGADGVNSIAFSAYSDANGANPHGYYTQTIAAGQPEAQQQSRFNVTCLAVLGGHAALGLTPADASTASRWPPGTVVVMFDGGPGGGSDLYTYRPVSTAENCSNYLFDAYISPASGNITVRDDAEGLGRGVRALRHVRAVPRVQRGKVVLPAIPRIVLHREGA
jgi:hypothetical protein